MVAVSLYLGVAVVFLVIAYMKYVFRFRREGEPPLVPGHFFWGNSIQFSKHAVQFFRETQKSLGDIFTIRFVNQYITLVLDPQACEAFAKEKNFDFDNIQKQVNRNVFNFELKESRKMIIEASKKVNGKYLSTGLENFAHNLTLAFQNMGGAQSSPSTGADQNGNTTTDSTRWSKVDLRPFTANTIFNALFYTIFGRPSGKEEVEKFTPGYFYKSFEIFHKVFNYLWIGVPVSLFPKACEALKVLSQQPNAQCMLSRQGVSDYIKFATRFMLENEQSHEDVIGHNLVFLHVNYNTFRINYWCIYHLLEQKHARQALLRELEEAIEERRVEGKDEVGFTMEDFDHLPLLDSFLKETMRVVSGMFVARTVTEDTHFTMPSGKTYLIRKGDRVAIYPPHFHKDPEIFEDPETFKFDRFVDAKFYRGGQEVKYPLIAFGFLCPGKRMSTLQSKWFILNFLNSFNMELEEGSRAVMNTQLYGQEVLPPISDVQVLYTLKKDAPKLVFLPRRYGS